MRQVLGALLIVLGGCPEPFPGGEPRNADVLFARELERSQLDTRVGSWQLSISTSVAGTEIPIQIRHEPPRSVRIVSEVPDVGRFVRGFDGAVGWANDPGEPPRRLSGEELEDLQREARLIATDRWPRQYKRRRLAGAELVDGKPTWRVDAADSQGRPMSVWFHRKTGLRVAETATIDGPRGAASTRVTYSDWERHGPWVLPTHMTQTLGRGITQVTITEFVVDMPKEVIRAPPGL